VKREKGSGPSHRDQQTQGRYGSAERGGKGRGPGTYKRQRADVGGGLTGLGEKVQINLVIVAGEKGREGTRRPEGTGWGASQKKRGYSSVTSCQEGAKERPKNSVLEKKPRDARGWLGRHVCCHQVGWKVGGGGCS